jgi:hypothetical protein
VLEVLRENGLVQGEDGLKVIMMCEVPSNALHGRRIPRAVRRLFSIGSNDMTQLTLGLDRDSAIVAGLFDERDPAVKKMLSMAISAAKSQGQVHRHLRPGTERSPGPGAVADGTGHRVRLAEPRHRGRYLVATGQGQGLILAIHLPFAQRRGGGEINRRCGCAPPASPRTAAHPRD